MRDLNEHTLTDAVVASFANSPDPRTREIMTSLVRHLHAFAREVRLTEVEWQRGIEFLTATGQKCDATRQEFILLSDTLGLSMLTVAMNHEKPAGCTEPTVFGPFHVDGAPHFENGDDIANGASGIACEVTCTIRGRHGEAVAGAIVDVWQADAEGRYDLQVPNREVVQGRGVLRADDDGRFHFRSIVAEAYAIADDGPVGEMLRASGRHPWRPAHLHFMIQAPGYETLVTHVFRNGDPYLDGDAVFGVRESLIGDWLPQPDGSYRLAFEFVLNPAKAAAELQLAA